MDGGVYIHRGRRADGADERGWGDVVDGDGAWLELVHVAAAPVARERDDGEPGMHGEQLAQEGAQTDPAAGGDAHNDDLRAGVLHCGHDLASRLDFGEDLEVGLAREDFADDVAEEGRHGPEHDAGRGHVSSVRVPPRIMASWSLRAHQPPGWKEGADGGVVPRLSGPSIGPALEKPNADSAESALGRCRSRQAARRPASRYTASAPPPGSGHARAASPGCGGRDSSPWPRRSPGAARYPCSTSPGRSGA